MTLTDLPLPELNRPETLSQRAYQAIRHAIRSGTLRHGQRYSENTLSASMGISRTPVREALIELARQGIVDVIPQKGFQLHVLTPAEQDEVFALRSALESLVVRRLAQGAPPGGAEQLRTILDQQSGQLANADRFLDLDEQFHLLMPQLIGYGRTHKILAGLRGAIWLMGSAALLVHGRASSILVEHRAIVSAIAAGDGEAAATAVQHHLATTADAIRVAADHGVGNGPDDRPPSLGTIEPPTGEKLDG
jgi:DNA-binding GntR family transcriptional regulator